MRKWHRLHLFVLKRPKSKNTSGRAVIFRLFGLAAAFYVSGIAICAGDTRWEAAQVLKTNAMNSVTYSPDGSRLLTGGDDHAAHLWDVGTGREIQRFPTSGKVIFAVPFSPDGKTVLAGGESDVICLFEAASGRLLRRFNAQPAVQQVGSVGFSPDGRKIAAGDFMRHSVRLWDVANGRVLREFLGDKGIFSPDGRTLATLVEGATPAENAVVYLWDLSSGREIHQLLGHAYRVNQAAFSYDGKILATAGFDKTVRLWDVSSGRELRQLRGHTDQVLSVAFSPDGTKIVTGGYDDTARLWDAASGRELREFEGNSEAVYSVAFSPDGRTVAAGDDDDTTKILNATTEIATPIAAASATPPAVPVYVPPSTIPPSRARHPG